MFHSTPRLLAAGVLAGSALVALSNAAQATTATNVGNSVVGIYLKDNPQPSVFPATGAESDIFLISADGTTTGFGTIGAKFCELPCGWPMRKLRNGCKSRFL